MVYKLIESGPFRGLPAIHVAPSDLEGASFLQEVTEKITKAVGLFSITANRQHIVFTDVDMVPFEKLMSMVKLLKYHGWFCIAEGSSQKLSPAASEFTFYVAHHYAENGDTWLNYPCAGFVLHGLSVVPVFTGKTAQVPKFIYGKFPDSTVFEYMTKAELAWAYQPIMEEHMEVVL